MRERARDFSPRIWNRPFLSRHYRGRETEGHALTTSRTTDPVLWKDFETLYQVGTIGDLTDGQLLERFVEGTGGTAETGFVALVERHGAMVLRVCQQVLGDTHDAQDAFQATFLVLVRRAGAVRRRDSVASWLFGVARRVARRARVNAARRRAHEARTAARGPAPVPPPGEPESWPELHEEVERLPEKYRSAVVLCYLEGLTTEAAARRLGCPQGTVLSRLSRAREQLRRRLTRRGVAVPAGLLTAGSAPLGGSATTSPALIEATTRAALQFAAGRAVAGVVPASVVILTSSITRDMLMTKILKAAALLLAAGAASAGAVGLARQEPGNKDGGIASRPAAGTGGASRNDSERIQGTWLNIAQETNGEEVSPAKDRKLVITAEMMSSEYTGADQRLAEEDRKNGTDKASYKIDPSREPKTIDITPVAGSRKGKVAAGIYRIDGDTLQICFDTDGPDRPTEFDTRPGDHNRLMVFRREIPIRIVASPAPKAATGQDEAREPVLEFRIVADAAHDRTAAQQARGPDGLKNPPAGYRWVELDDRCHLDRAEGDIVRDEPGPGGKARKHLLVQLDRLNLTEKDLAQIAAIKVERDQLAISLRFQPVGGRKLSQLTRTHLPEKTGGPFDFKYKLAIIIDGVLVAAPYINSEIRDTAVIELGRDDGPEEAGRVIKHIREAMREPAAGKRSP